MKSFIRIFVKIENQIHKLFSDWGALFLRLTVGIVFVPSGFGKLIHLDRTIEFFSSLGIPLARFQAPLAALTELLCGALVLFGVASRLSAFPLIPVMSVAIWTAKREELDGLSSLALLPEFLIIVILVGIISLGSGRFSVDARLQKNFRE